MWNAVKETYWSIIYRSPSVTDHNCIQELEYLFSTKNLDNIKFQNQVFLGDFNFKDIYWELQISNMGKEHLTSIFLETVCDAYLFQHITEATSLSLSLFLSLSLSLSIL